MDNRINEIRRKISALRAEMLAEEDVIRDQIGRDLDCTESAQKVMAMRAQLSALIRAWKAAGGGERLPTVRERLTESFRPARKPKAVPPPKATKPHLQKRRGAERA